MDNKKKLIETAINKDFTSKVIGKSVYSKYSSKTDLFYYLWMCELCDWLKKEHGIHIITNVNISGKWYFEIYGLSNKRCAQVYDEKYDIIFNKKESALERGLIESLKLI